MTYNHSFLNSRQVKKLLIKIMLGTIIHQLKLVKTLNNKTTAMAIYNIWDL